MQIINTSHDIRLHLKKLLSLLSALKAKTKALIRFLFISLKIASISGKTNPGTADCNKRGRGENLEQTGQLRFTAANSKPTMNTERDLLMNLSLTMCGRPSRCVC